MSGFFRPRGIVSCTVDLSSVVENPLVPEFVLRLGIRQIVAMRLREQRRGGPGQHTRRLMALIDSMKRSPIALSTRDANRQHYEVSPELFERVLGPHLKYSGCYWPAGATCLADAERASLLQVCERADLRDGQDILDLGCGWGSLSLLAAESYPRSRVVAVSNSAAQKQLITARAARRGLENLEVITADMNEFRAPGQFDRIVSIEMFEHMRNYDRLLSRIASWMRDDARLFVHVFAHSQFAYVYDDAGPSDWMAREFFTGGMMPSASLMLHFQSCVELVDHWTMSGTHYQKTAEAWLDNLNANRDELLGIVGERQLARWRLFFVACAEMFGYRAGREWIIAHYSFRKSAT